MRDASDILKAIEEGQAKATDELLPLVYDELRRLAARRLSAEDSTQSLQATALVHEAYLRLVADPTQRWEGRAHFFGAAAEAMRRILIDRARSRRSQKRGGGWEKVDWDQADVAASMPGSDLLALNEALVEFEQIDPIAAQLVKLRFFVGLGHQEAAELLGISRRVADRLWAYARAWLYQALRTDSAEGTRDGRCREP